MKFSALVTPARIALDVAATSRKRALEEIARLLAASAPTVSEADVATALFAREKLGTTTLSTGVALPRARVAGLNASIGALLRLRHGVTFDSREERSVDLLFGVIMPPQTGDEEAQQLKSIAEVFADEYFCAEVRAARDVASVFALIAR